MAGDWRTTKTKRKRELPTWHETAPQRTGCISQPKCKEGKQTETWCTAIRNTGEKKPAVQPLTQGMTVPRHRSWSVSACVIWGVWRGLGRNRNAVPVLLLLFHVMFWPWALAVTWESSKVPGGGKSAPWSQGRENLPQCFQQMTSIMLPPH